MKMTRTLPLAAALLCLGVSACQGGRQGDFDAQAVEAEPRDNPSAPNEQHSSNGNPLLSPLGSLLAPTGLGFRVDTIYGQGPDAIHRTAYGVDALPIGIDVDGDSSTGNLLGADINVHFFSLLLYARLEIRRLDGAPDPLPLKVEVSVLDPRNLLGLPGLLSIVDPDLRIALGMDALSLSAPERYIQELTVTDSLFEFLPRFTTASLSSQVEDAAGPVATTLAMYADRSGERADGLELSALSDPATDTDIDLSLAPDALESSLQLSVAQAARLDIQVDTYDGMQTQPSGQRDISVTMDTLNSQFTLSLDGVDGLSSVDQVETHYLIETDQSIENLSLRLSDTSSDGQRGEAYAHVQPLPTQLEVVRGADESISMQASEAIDDLIFAQADNTSISLGPDFQSEQGFEKHLIRQFDGEVDGQRTQLLQVRLGGLQNLQAQLGDATAIQAQLSAAPFELREESSQGFQEAVIDELPSEFRLAFPDT